MKAQNKFDCTVCGKDAYIGYTKWDGPNGPLIKKGERLCNQCLKKRTGVAIF